MKNNNQISEKNIIHNYLSKLNDNKYESFNFKNDAAFLKVPKSTKIVVTNDTIVESVDFFKNDSPESIATKIATYNLSDISAMGSSPYAYTLSLSLPSKINKEWIKKFTNRLLKIQKKYNFFLLGGDVSKSNKIVISSNFFGYIKKGKILTRSGCKKNDDIWVTGDLGNSAIGLKIIQKKIKTNILYKKYFINKYLYPIHCHIGYRINEFASSAIDISDGFYGDLEKLLNENKLGASISSNTFPFSNKTKNLIKKRLVKVDYLLTAGDDYQLIFTAKPSKYLNIKRIAEETNIKITKVGNIIDKKGIYIDNQSINIVNKSFEHFF